MKIYAIILALAVSIIFFSCGRTTINQYVTTTNNYVTNWEVTNYTKSVYGTYYNIIVSNQIVSFVITQSGEIVVGLFQSTNINNSFNIVITNVFAVTNN